MNNVLAKILETSFTPHDLSHKVGVLKNYLISKLFSRENQITLSASDIKYINSLGKEFLNQFNKDNIYPIFDQIEAEVKKLSSLVIYLPLEIPDQEIINLGTKLRSDFGEKFIFEIRLDPTLIAGCALVWKGMYKDYSLKAKIAENRAQILASFKQTESSFKSQESRV